jgi:hypothetical protein
MEHYEQFEQLLQHRSFKELNAGELLLAKRFITTEEEYESLRRVTQQLHAVAGHDKESGLTPDPHIWKRIKHTNALSAQKQSGYFWMRTTMPVYATVVLLVIVGSLCWYGGSIASAANTIATQPTLVKDTVFMASKPDTIVREKIIYAKREIILTSTAPTTTASTQQTETAIPTKGVTMKEKEELEELLVSGSI